MTDRRTDRRTELRWLRRAIAVPAVVRKNTSCINGLISHFIVIHTCLTVCVTIFYDLYSGYATEIAGFI